jgi:putative glutamine amidotransferase
MERKPIVGIPADRREYTGHPFHMAGEKYLAAIVRSADAVPLIIPVLSEMLDIKALLRHVDGVLLSGSYSNVEPHHYEGAPSEEGTLHDPHRDAVTLPMIRLLLDNGVPLFAICRGYQEFNVAMGGSLHQKIIEVPGYHNHLDDPDDPLDVQYGPSHPVVLTEGGLLHDLTGQATAMVNSLHEQGVAKLGEGLSVEAVADDGLIEAFRVDDAPAFNLGVQWHPEWRSTEDDLSTAMFKAFGDACRERASRRQV